MKEELICETYEIATEATSGLVHSRQLLMRQLTNGDGDPGLCSYKGATFPTFIVMSNVASPLLTFSC